MSLDFERRDDLAILTLNRPEALNALSFALIDDLERRLVEIGDSDARALVVTGAGDKAFCAGADITQLMGRTMAEQKRSTRRGQGTFSMIEALPMPSVAVINGYAFGGGLELAMACTFRLATANAKVGLPEIKLGLIPGYGGTQRLPRLMGEARALEMIMTGRTVLAEEAHEIGLVNRLVEGDPVEAGAAFAGEFTGYSMRALGFSREAVSRALDVSLEDGMKIEADLSTLAFQTADSLEGMNAFLEKRKPEFKDG
jgi:enoyl-CoA hydratase